MTHLDRVARGVADHLARRRRARDVVRDTSPSTSAGSFDEPARPPRAPPRPQTPRLNTRRNSVRTSTIVCACDDLCRPRPPPTRTRDAAIHSARPAVDQTGRFDPDRAVSTNARRPRGSARRSADELSFTPPVAKTIGVRPARAAPHAEAAARGRCRRCSCEARLVPHGDVQRSSCSRNSPRRRQQLGWRPSARPALRSGNGRWRRPPRRACRVGQPVELRAKRRGFKPPSSQAERSRPGERRARRAP